MDGKFIADLAQILEKHNYLLQNVQKNEEEKEIKLIIKEIH